VHGKVCWQAQWVACVHEGWCKLRSETKEKKYLLVFWGWGGTRYVERRGGLGVPAGRVRAEAMRCEACEGEGEGEGDVSDVGWTGRFRVKVFPKSLPTMARWETCFFREVQMHQHQCSTLLTPTPPHCIQLRLGRRQRCPCSPGPNHLENENTLAHSPPSSHLRDYSIVAFSPHSRHPFLTRGYS
jgi:hypothetical protein